ncbi:hypothetical protein KI659_17430 [Litoribacter alkaliphilus]|uniref:Tail specific protease domain-containing protein n=1 Tax=Litoribacter ruber TaxID=702568 RepID=A0AAP2CM42_9BACT|nr:S41 family peptidase [Litoribacter alkaliphilus]MBS9525806.1 hypothetical protein [Litoribacter alkaliphilus]
MKNFMSKYKNILKLQDPKFLVAKTFREQFEKVQALHEEFEFKYKLPLVILFALTSLLNPLASQTTSTFNLGLNNQLSISEMEEDLQVFIDIRKNVNSGLYIYRTEEEVDSLYRWAFEQIKRPLKTSEFFKIISNLTDFEGSVHNYTEPGTDDLNELKKQKTYFPYHLTYLEGKIIFDGLTEKIPPGSQILNINGKEDLELMQSFQKYFPVDGFNTSYKLSASVNNAFAWRYVIEYGATDKFEVKFLAPGKIEPQTEFLQAVTFEEREKNLSNKYSAPISDLLDYEKQPPYSYEQIDAKTGLLNLRFFGFATGKDDPQFDLYTQFLDSVFTVLDEKLIPNLVIDVRNNPGGSDPTFEQPVRYLSDSSFQENLEAHIIFNPQDFPYDDFFWGVSTDARIDSATKVMGLEFLDDYFEDFNEGRSYQNPKYNPIYQPKSPAYHGQVYMLINENTASAASHFASLMKGYARNLTTVGVETVGGYYEHNGHIGLVYELPNSKIKSKFSVVYVVHDAPQRADQPYGRGVIPDYELWPTIEDFLKHKDSQKEFVLKLISNS